MYNDKKRQTYEDKRKFAALCSMEKTLEKILSDNKVKELMITLDASIKLGQSGRKTVEGYREIYRLDKKGFCFYYLHSGRRALTVKSMAGYLLKRYNEEEVLIRFNNEVEALIAKAN